VLYFVVGVVDVVVVVNLVDFVLHVLVKKSLQAKSSKAFIEGGIGLAVIFFLHEISEGKEIESPGF